MKFLVTGANGFIGRNLSFKLRELGHESIAFVRGDTLEYLKTSLGDVDGIFHLAGENRPTDIFSYDEVNVGLTRELVNLLVDNGKKVPLILTSSTQVNYENPYGISKRVAEEVVISMSRKINNTVCIYRLPGVFGKWCRPNYNSVVANFCFNIANNLPIKINDPSSPLSLVYIDDVVSSFIKSMHDMCLGSIKGVTYSEPNPIYETTVSSLANQLMAFQNCRTTLEIERVGSGLTRALYSTYVSYMPKNKFVYDVPIYRDDRGIFV